MNKSTLKEMGLNNEYDDRCDLLGELCEKLGLDCSNCYDFEDFERLIIRAFNELKPAVGVKE